VAAGKLRKDAAAISADYYFCCGRHDGMVATDKVRCLMIDSVTKELLSGDRLFYEWTGLEKVLTMIDGGGADTGGPNVLPHGKSTWKPGTDTSPALLEFSPAKRPSGKPWDNLYRYGTISRTPPKIVYAAWELEFSLQAADLPGNAREFEIELCEAGWTYNMAWQYKWSHVDGPPAWSLFDQVAGKWAAVPSIPPPSVKSGVFVSAQAYFIIDRANGVTYHDSIVIDGATYPVNLAHGKKLKWSPQTNYLHNAVQIDSMGNGVPCSIQIKNWNVRGL
jgi:hypothetical protein